MKIKKKKQVHDLKKQAKPAEEKSDNKLLVQKKIDNRLLKERASEIQQIGDETNYDDLIYYFKGPSSPVNFTGYEDPSDIYDKTKDGDKKNTSSRRRAKKFKLKLCEIASGNLEHKSDDQLDTIKNAQNLYNSRQKTVDLFNDNAKIISQGIYEANKKNTGTGLKILTPKQMLQRLPIALAQVKAGNNSEHLLNENRQFVYLSKPHVLTLKFTDQLDLTRGENRIALSNLSIYYTWKNIKSLYNNNKFKISVPTGNDKFQFPLIDHTFYLIFKIILNTF